MVKSASHACRLASWRSRKTRDGSSLHDPNNKVRRTAPNLCGVRTSLSTKFQKKSPVFQQFFIAFDLNYLESIMPTAVHLTQFESTLETLETSMSWPTKIREHQMATGNAKTHSPNIQP